MREEKKRPKETHLQRRLLRCILERCRSTGSIKKTPQTSQLQKEMLQKHDQTNDRDLLPSSVPSRPSGNFGRKGPTGDPAEASEHESQEPHWAAYETQGMTLSTFQASRSHAASVKQRLPACTCLGATVPRLINREYVQLLIGQHSSKNISLERRAPSLFLCFNCGLRNL